MQGSIFNIQRFSLYDGPGVRTVVFLKGCPLRCPWCHNPEGLEPRQQTLYDPKKCIGCGSCADACALGLHAMREGMHLFDRTLCTGCGRCVAECPAEALSTAGKMMSAEDVLAEVLKDRSVFCESGGGLTVSGGEPLLQWRFTAELLRMAKSAGLNTCIETSGFGSADAIAAVLPWTDLFYFDWKLSDPEALRNVCGADMDVIERCMNAIDASGKKAALRCPIIPGINDTAVHCEGIASAANRHPSVAEIQPEPYHRLGIGKAGLLGMQPGYESQPPAKEHMELIKNMIAKHTTKPIIIS